MKRFKVLIGMHSPLAPGDAKVEYSTDKFVSAPRWLAENGYHLTVFRTLNQARDFVKKQEMMDYEVQIWECEVRNKVNLKDRCYLYSIARGYLEIVLDKDKQWPAGTEMYKEVRLTRLIQTLWLDE